MRDADLPRLLKDLRRKDVRLTSQGGLLRVDAPKGAITEALRAALEHHKPQLMRMVQTRKVGPVGESGLRASWSKPREWIELTDVVTGEQVELRAEDCAGWMVREADAPRGASVKQRAKEEE